MSDPQSAESPAIEGFSGAAADAGSSAPAQLPDSLQILLGTSVVLSWSASNAPDGFELTCSAAGAPQRFPASESGATVTPASDTQEYSLVALAGGARSAPKTVTVSTHGPGEVVSAHAQVNAPGVLGDWEMMHGPIPPSPTLARPLVMITGLTMKASSYDPMSNALARVAENGQTHVYSCVDNTFHAGALDGPTETPPPQARLFQIEYINNGAAPSEKAPQLARAFQDIAAATGVSNFDVACHSAGCTDFRLYLNTRPAADAQAIGINQVSFIGPASHGTEMGNFGKTFGAIAGLQKAGGELAVGSTLIATLNDAWDTQLNQMASCQIIAVTGAPTMSASGIRDGDGFMPLSDCPMPGASLVVLRGLDPTAIAHLEEVGYSGVVAAVQAVL